MTEKFFSNEEHLAAELRRLDLLLRSEVEKFKSRMASEPAGVFRGMYISDSEVQGHLGAAASSARVDCSVLLEGAGKLRAETDERVKASLEAGVPLAFPQLSRLFGLSEFEQAVVLLALAPEMDLKYERIFAYLQDDITRKRPTLDLVLRVLCPEAPERIRRRQEFAEHGVLSRARILRRLERDEASLLASGVALDPAIVDYLLQSGGTDRDFASCIRPFASERDLSELRVNETMKNQLTGLVKRYLETGIGAGRRLIIQISGASGAGKKTLAASLCRRFGVPLFVLDLGEIVRRFEDFEDGLARALRQCLLNQGAAYLHGFDQFLSEDDNNAANRRIVRRCLEELSWLSFLGTSASWRPEDLFKGLPHIAVDLPFPDEAERRALWASLADGPDELAADADLTELAVKFRLTPGRMAGALEWARNHALLRGPAETQINRDDLYRACYMQSNRNLGALARRLRPKHHWNDIILPPGVVAQLREICGQVKHRQTVYGDWGYGGKLSLGKGLCVFFHGQSGVGKTMAVEIIANALHLEAYKIDLSTVVSKYVGETEKNLGRIFHEAETSNAILFFDEADALFGKRSEVKDAHDRYANIEINYLLQKMEEFEGLLILASNLRKNIDEAFYRRMHFSVEFPFPDVASRYRIWRQHFPDAAPRSEDIDFNYLAERFALAGGNIRNIVVNAAFLAAENSGTIHMEHLIRATKREYEKIGRLCTDAEFTPYQSFLREA